MAAIIIYLLKTVCCSALFAGYYWLFLRNRRLHVFNRFYILLAVAASCILPALDFEWQLADVPQAETAYRLMQVLPANGADEEVVAMHAPLFTPAFISGALYLLIVFSTLFTMIARVVSLYRVKHNSDVVRSDGYLLIHTSHEKAPFSFLNMIFWKPSISVDTAEGRRILYHELAHVRQKHTFDKLFMQMALAFYWFNPFFWLFRKELAHVHEFLADEAAIEDRDTESFARMLLQEFCGNSYPGIVHPFFYSSVKRRLFMLEKKHKPKFAHMRRLLAIPLLGLATVLFSFTFSDAPVVKANKTIAIAIDAGHGGKDDGATGINGIKEKDLALKITKRLSAVAGAYNVKVVSIRPDDEYVMLEQRSAKANDVAADIMVSVHLNQHTAENTAADGFNGFDIIIGKGSANYNQSRSLGSALAAKLGGINIETRMMDKGLHVLRNAKMPAVLIECGYVDNATDVDRINNDKELDKLCRAIMSGLVAYNNATK